MRQALRNSAGKVIGSCDSMPFDIFGRRPYRPRARLASVVADRAPDINVEMDGPRMQDVIPGYNRL